MLWFITMLHMVYLRKQCERFHLLHDPSQQMHITSHSNQFLTQHTVFHPLTNQSLIHFTLTLTLPTNKDISWCYQEHLFTITHTHTYTHTISLTNTFTLHHTLNAAKALSPHYLLYLKNKLGALSHNFHVRMLKK